MGRIKKAANNTAANKDKDNFNRAIDNAAENDATIGAGDMSPETESNNGTNAVLSTDIIQVTGNISTNDTCTIANNGVAAESGMGVILDIIHGNADDNCGDSETCEDIDISTIPTEMLQEFPLDVFPAWVRNHVVSLSISLQSPIPTAALLVISLVAACIARIFYVVTDRGQREPSNLWTMSVSDPGDSKTPIFNALKTPLTQSDLLRRMIGDITVPSFIKRLNSARKLIGIADEPELLDCLTNTTNIKPSSILHAYNETIIIFDRCNKETVTIEKPSLTLGIAGQTDVFESQYKSANGQRLKASGFFDRLLVVFVTTLAGSRNYWQEPPSASEKYAADYNKCMSLLASFEQCLAKAGIISAEVRLSPEAETCRRALMQEWENCIATNADYEMIRTWISKSGGLLLRLAGNLFMMDLVCKAVEVSEPIISETVMARAIRLVEYFRDKTIMWHREMGDSHRRDAANHLLQYMLRHPERAEWSVRDLRAAMHNTTGLSTQNEFNEALDDLVNQSLVDRWEPPTGGRPTILVRLRSHRGEAA